MLDWDEFRLTTEDPAEVTEDIDDCLEVDTGSLEAGEVPRCMESIMSSAICWLTSKLSRLITEHGLLGLDLAVGGLSFKEDLLILLVIEIQNGGYDDTDAPVSNVTPAQKCVAFVVDNDFCL